LENTFSHYVIAWGFVAFVLIHVFEVLISGAFNQLRGIITGWYRIDEDPPTPATETTAESRHD